MTIWIALVLVLATYDIDFTIRYVTPATELNPLIRLLAPHVGWVFACLAGILVPTLAVIGLATWLHLPSLLAFVCGVRAMLTCKQSLLKGPKLKPYSPGLALSRDAATSPA